MKEFGKRNEVREPEASLSGLASLWLGPEEKLPGHEWPHMNSLVDYAPGGPHPPRNPKPGRVPDWWPDSGLKQPPTFIQPARPAIPTHLCLPRDTECSGTVPPPRPHSSQNSGEVSEPPQPQLPAPLRTAGTGPFSSQQPRQTRNHQA